jgi:hypothetical protein
MMKNKQEQLLESYRSGWSLPWTGSVSGWAANCVTLPPNFAPPSGKFDPAYSKYLIQPLEDIKNDRIRQINILASVKTGKSLIQELAVAYRVVHSSGNILWLFQPGDTAGDEADSRIMPILKSVNDISTLLDDGRRYSVKRKTINMPHMSIFIDAAKESIVQSKDIATLVGDEVYQWPPGILNQAKNRTTAHTWDKKIIFVSTAGDEGDEWDNEFNTNTTIYEWAWRCPKCNLLQPYYFNKIRDDGTYAGLRWNKKINENKSVDVLSTIKTARMECYGCKHTIYEKDRKQLNDTGEYICIRQGRDDVRSYHWNCLCHRAIPFSDIVESYLNAKHQYNVYGNIIPLREFYTHKLAQPFLQNNILPNIRAAIAQFDVNDIPDERVRILSVDRQQDWFYFVVVSWGENNTLKVLDKGRVPDYAAIREKQIQWKVKDQHTCIDVGYNQTETASSAIRFGHFGILGKTKFWFSWIGMKGSPYDSFNHTDKDKNIKAKLPYSELYWIDPNQGKKSEGERKLLPAIKFSNFVIKGIVWNIYKGKSGKLLLNEPDEEFESMMNAERCKKIKDKQSGRESYRWVQEKDRNEAFDCMCMNVVLAMYAGILDPSLKVETVES